MQQEIQDNTAEQISFSKQGEGKMLLDILNHGILQLRRARGELGRRGRDKEGVQMCLAEGGLLLLLLSGIKLKQLRNWRKFKDRASNSSKSLPPSA